MWVNVEWAEGAVLGGLRREEQNENNSILSKGPESWGGRGECVQLLGQRRAGLLFFRFLSYQPTAGAQPETGSP